MPDYIFKIILPILIIGGSVAILIMALRFGLRRRERLKSSFRRKVFLVMLSKEAEEEAKKKEAMDQKKDIKEAIAIMETLYAALAGASRVKDWSYPFYLWRRFWLGHHEQLAFEMVAHQGLIKFFMVVSEEYKAYVEQQIQAIFPSANIDEVEDYNIFQAQGEVLGNYLTLSKSSVLSLKTYKKLDTDPVEGVLNNLSKLKKDEGAAIQILIRPAHSHWRGKALEVGRRLHKGEKLEEALRATSLSGLLSKIMLAPITVSGWILREIISPKKSKEMEKTDKAPPVRLFQREEEIIKSMEEKISKSCFETNIRLIASAADRYRAKAILHDMVGSFAQFAAHESGNKLAEKLLWLKKRFISDFIHRNFRENREFVLGTEELSSICHFPLPTAETPNILWLQARAAAPPVNIPKEGLILGIAEYRGIAQEVRVKREDRRRHVYIIGMTGSGKSVLMSNMAIQDIQNGEGVCIVDPHGSLVEAVLPHIPKERIDDVVYFNPADLERPIGLNMLEAGTPNEMDFACQEMIAIFYKLVTDPAMIGPMFEHYMRNAMLTLMADREYPGTIADIPRIFTDPEFQKYKLTKVTDPVVRAFWEKEMAKTTDFHKSEMLGYLISKVGRFVENEMMRNIIGQGKSAFNFREIMDNKKILLVNLSKGQTGEVNSNLLGLIMVSKLQMAALARADMPEEKRQDFYLYIDEFQNFITDSISIILAEARKYRLDLIMAHQYIGQLGGGGIEGKPGDSKVKDAIFGNVGTIVSFRIGVDDAEVLAKQFAPVLNEYDVMNIARFHAYIRLLIDNTASKAFTVKTLPPKEGSPEVAEMIKQLSRLKYGRDRELVNAEILERTKLGEPAAESVVAERSVNL